MGSRPSADAPSGGARSGGRELAPVLSPHFPHEHGPMLGGQGKHPEWARKGVLAKRPDRPLHDTVWPSMRIT